MSRLNEILLEHYSKHYARVSMTFEDPRAKSETFKECEKQYGQILRALPPGSQVADLGCGIGMMLEWLSSIPGIRAVGVDGSAAQIEIARRNLSPSVELHCADLESFVRLRPAAFAVISAVHILEHIPGDDNLLGLLEASRESLVPGGVLMCVVPNAANWIGSYSRYSDLTHVRLFTTASLLQLLEAAGFARSEIRPRRATDVSQTVRMWVEHWTHRAIFRLCGRSTERNFSKDLTALGYR